MKFEYIRKTDKPIMEYRQMVKTGDMVDYNDHFSRKALKRPQDFKLIKEIPAIESVPNETTEPVRVKRKYTRRVKRGDETGSP